MLLDLLCESLYVQRANAIHIMAINAPARASPSRTSSYKLVFTFGTYMRTYLSTGRTNIVAPPTSTSIGPVGKYSPDSMAGIEGLTNRVRVLQVCDRMVMTLFTRSSSTPIKTVALPSRRNPPVELMSVAPISSRLSASSSALVSRLLIIAMTNFKPSLLCAIVASCRQSRL